MRRAVNPTTKRRGLLSRMRPSHLVLASAAPFVLYLFITAPSYQAALGFLVPGLATTITVTVFAYVAASVLGIILASLLAMKLEAKTVLRYGAVGAIMLVAAVVLFSRPPLRYSLVGSSEGRVAILNGTPSSMADSIKSGSFPGSSGVRSVRAVTDVDVALERLASGEVGAAFIPTADVPPGTPVLWETAFLAPSVKKPALVLIVFGSLLLLLAFAASQSGHHPLAIFAELYVDTLRGIPMLVVILYVGFPLQGAIRDATGGIIDMSRLTRGVVGISLGYAAYMAEIFRAGIEAIPHGQVEAARSLGLNAFQTARFVVLPQALRIVVPPLGNEFIAMLKDTSLLSVLSVRDITQRAREFQAATFQVFPPFNTVAMLYIGLTLAASSLVKWLERRTAWTR